MIKRANQKKKKGFSLIELIIVLAVMAIIALIAIPNFTAVRNNSKVKADTQTCETVKRTVLMLTADESVVLTDKTKAGSIALSFSNTGKIAEATPTNLTEKVTGSILEALGEVKAPQGNKIVDSEGTTASDVTAGNDITGYTVTISKDGDVSVAVSQAKKPTPPAEG